MTNVRINRAREFAHVITAHPGIVVTPLYAGLRDSAAYRMIYCSRSSHLDTSKYTGKSLSGLGSEPDPSELLASPLMLRLINCSGTAV